MYVYLNKQQTINLNNIVTITEKKNKKGKQKIIIRTRDGHKFLEKVRISTIIKRIEKNEGLLRKYNKE